MGKTENLLTYESRHNVFNLDPSKRSDIIDDLNVYFSREIARLRKEGYGPQVQGLNIERDEGSLKIPTLILRSNVSKSFEKSNLAELVFSDKTLILKISEYPRSLFNPSGLEHIGTINKTY